MAYQANAIPGTQLVCVGRQVDVFPRCSRDAVLASFDRVPGRRPEIGVPVVCSVHNAFVGFSIVRHLRSMC
jgi:hypothetical protein